MRFRIFLPIMRLLTFLTVCLIGSFLVFAPACKDSTKSKSENEAGESEDKFADNIRKTDFQSPEDEQKSFKLPEGFEITLFASEPDISKPHQYGVR